MKSPIRLQNGFTVVELIIVIVVIAILAAVVVVGYNGIQANARDKALLSDINSVEAELARYATKNGGEFSSALDWDSSSTVNANIRFTPSDGNVIVVTTRDGDYCIKAYNVKSNTKTLATAKSKGSSEFACNDGWKYISSNGNENYSGGHSCGIATNNRAYCWGVSGIGNGANSSSVPAAVVQGAMPSTTVKAVATGVQHSCAIGSDDLAYCWGNSSSGALGDGTTGASYTYQPVAVSTAGALAGKTIRSIEAGGWSTCAIASDGLPYCWGATVGSAVPVAINASGVLAGKTLTSLAIGSWGTGQHVCGIASDGAAYCWGRGTNGQLGNGTTTTSNNPVAVTMSGALAGKTLKSITSGGVHTCAIASDDAAYCWGDAGYLGTAAGVRSTTPVAVSMSGVLAGKTIAQIRAELWHTCAVTSDGIGACWGSNGSGQLGDNTTTSANEPISVLMTGALNNKKLIQLSTGKDFTCSIATDLSGACWGLGTNGRLGNGSSSNSSTPVPITIPTL